MRDSATVIAMVTATSTRDRTAAGVRSKLARYEVWITRVNTSYRNSDGAPKSLSTYRATSSAPAAAAGRTWRTVTAMNVARAEWPRDRETSSSAGSAWRSAAATGRNT